MALHDAASSQSRAGGRRRLSISMASKWVRGRQWAVRRSAQSTQLSDWRSVSAVSTIGHANSCRRCCSCTNVREQRARMVSVRARHWGRTSGSSVDLVVLAGLVLSGGQVESGD